MPNPHQIQGQQPADQTERPISGLGLVGLGVGAVGASGFLPYGEGRLWDKYIAGIRTVETIFPAAILRTFRTSEMLSPLESYNTISFGKETLQSKGTYGQYLRSTFGEAAEGLTLKSSGLSGVFGDITDHTGKAVGLGLNLSSSTPKGSTIADYWARLQGIDIDIAGIDDAKLTNSLTDSLLYEEYKSKNPGIPFQDWVKTLTPEERNKRLIMGVKFREEITLGGQKVKLSGTAQRLVAQAELAGNLARAKAAADVGRLNTVLKAPGEFPVVGKYISKIPILNDLAVKPGTATQMAGRFIGKGLAVGAAWKGLEYIDYLRAEGNAVTAAAASTIGGAALGAYLAKQPGMKLNLMGAAIGAAAGLLVGVAPRFDEGIIPGAATAYADINIARAQASEAIGLTGSLQEHNRIAPDFGKLSTAVGFAGVGAITAGLGDYLWYGATGIKKGIGSKEAMWSVLEQTREGHKDNVAKALWESELGKKFAKTKVGSVVSKVRHPMALGAIAGAALWAGINATVGIVGGNPMAAIPGAGFVGTEETPEELEAIYSGEQEVAIRKGRWWEFGRCIAARCIIPLKFNEIKRAEEIEIGDVLIGRNGYKANVVNIFTRQHKGEIISFSSALDRDTKTILTSNHIVPVLKKDENIIKEINAGDIRIGDYVETPIIHYDSKETVLSLTDVIKEPIIIDNFRAYAVQKNWCNKNLQKSGKHSIPYKLLLDKHLGSLIGYFLAEGSISFNNGNPTVIETVHAKNERWIVDDIIKISELLFDITPTVRFKKGIKDTDEGCWIVRICSAVVAKFFRWSFYPNKEYNKNDKQVPSWCRHASEEFKTALIDGYYEGDGHFDSARVISSARKGILLEIQKIAFSIGLLSSIGPKEENNFLGRWKLRFVPDSSTNPAVIIHDKRVFSAIRAIETEEYDGLVYDFEVDQKDHLFVAGTFLVHNSDAYEGGRIEYFRPHNVARLRTRAYQKGLYGSEEERWEYDPLLNPIDAVFGGDEFKYHYERKYAYERPAPLTSTYGEDVPFIGPLIAGTIGKILKPRKMVRPEEWNLGGGSYLEEPTLEPEEKVDYSLGGLGPGAPVLPDSGTKIFNDLMYRRREAIGLPGFLEGALQKRATGREEFFANQETVATMGKETGSEAWLWKHMNLGGAMGMSEPIRRFVPRTPSYLETYNPLSNNMPSWMPSDYYANDFMHGNPYDKIKEAEIRLPGAGYAALHPELQGVNPEDYPLIHRAKILSDIAMYSDAYKDTMEQAERANLSDSDREMLEQIKDQVRQKKQKKEFNDYRFNEDAIKTTPVTVTEVLDPRTVLTKEYGSAPVRLEGIGAVADTQQAMGFLGSTIKGSKINLVTSSLPSRQFSDSGALRAVAMVGGQDLGSVMQEEGIAKAAELDNEFEQLRFSDNERLAGQIAEVASHGADMPYEMLTPMSPFSKFIRKRSAIEEYAATQAVGTGNAFWDRPIDHFLAPTLNMTGYKLGITDIPESIQSRRGIEEYYDMLEWVKQSKIENEARATGDYEVANIAREKRGKTTFGADIFGMPPMSAIPRQDRDYFNEFINAQTEGERKDILSLIPENQQRVYVGQWMRQEEQAAMARMNAGVGTAYDKQVTETVARARKSEGFGINDDLEEQWKRETNGQMPYDEWIRTKRAAEYFDTHSLPGADWLGWHPSVDLEDVQMKQVQMEGLDYHDFDLWDNRERALARKPYINEGLVAQMDARASFADVLSAKLNAYTVGKVSGDRHANVQFSSGYSHSKPQYRMEIRDRRQGLVEKTYKEMGV